jgi:hypothetical protein
LDGLCIVFFTTRSLAILLWSTGGNGHVCTYHLGLILLGWDIGHFWTFEHSKDMKAASGRGKFCLGTWMRMWIGFIYH